MPRTSRKVPGYGLHKSSGQARVHLDGRDIYLGKHGSPESKQEYDRVIREWLAAGRRAPAAKAKKPHRPNAAAGTLTVNEVLVRYWGWAQDYYAPGPGQENGLHNLKNSLRPVRRLYGTTDADDFGPVALKAVRHAMIEDGLARNTINNRIGRIKRMFKWAVAEELVSPLVHQALSAVEGLQRGRSAARETAPVRPVEPEQVAAVLPFVSAPIASMVQVQALSGMRPGEVLAMKTGEIDRTGEIWLYKPSHHKNQWRGHDRVIPLGPRAQAILAPWLRDDPTDYLFQPAEGLLARAGKPHYASPHPRPKPRKRKPQPCNGRVDLRAGARYLSISYFVAISRACDLAFPHATLSAIPKAELTPAQAAELRAWRKSHRWGPNRLRHMAATTIRRDFGLEAAQVVLGHAKASVTEIYAQRDLTKAVEVARAIG